jgi:hypothetical protein
MMKKFNGFIFLMTLCTILVVSLLLLTVMHHVLLYGKAINRQEIQHQRFYQLEDTMLHLAQQKTNMIEKQCIVDQKNGNKVIEILVKKEGCSLVNGDIQYQYIIEDLGEFPCLVVRQNEQTNATRHTRITLLQSADEIHPVTSVLQVRNIKKITPLPCQSEVLKVSSGISSWRYIADYQKGIL